MFLKAKSTPTKNSENSYNGQLMQKKSHFTKSCSYTYTPVVK